jgi:hypothetical protein
VTSPTNHGSQGLPGPGMQAAEPTQLALHLQQKSSSGAPDDIAEIGKALTSAEQLLDLNTQEEYDQLQTHLLAVYPILMGLAQNENRAAQDLIADLSGNAEFLAEPGRLEGLLLVLPHVPTLPAEAIDLLQDATDPDSESLEVAIEVIFETGNPAALELFAEQVSNEEQDVELVQDWMRDPMLRHRADPAVVRMSIDLVTKPGFDRERKNSLVEAMFDYRPKDWYLTPASDDQSLPKPPARDRISKEARNLLSELAEAIATDQEVSTANKELAKKFVNCF